VTPPLTSIPDVVDVVIVRGAGAPADAPPDLLADPFDPFAAFVGALRRWW
jgi:hypothetical protein